MARSAPKAALLSQADVVSRLRPFLTQSVHVTQEREAGRLGIMGEGWVMVGNRFYYYENQVNHLLEQFKSATLKPIRNEKSAA